jgi:hypothetical protein
MKKRPRSGRPPSPALLAFRPRLSSGSGAASSWLKPWSTHCGRAPPPFKLAVWPFPRRRLIENRAVGNVVKGELEGLGDLLDRIFVAVAAKRNRLFGHTGRLTIAVVENLVETVATTISESTKGRAPCP